MPSKKKKRAAAGKERSAAAAAPSSGGLPAAATLLPTEQLRLVSALTPASIPMSCAPPGECGRLRNPGLAWCDEAVECAQRHVAGDYGSGPVLYRALFEMLQPHEPAAAAAAAAATQSRQQRRQAQREQQQQWEQHGQEVPTVIQLGCIGDMRDWLWLEAKEAMGPRPPLLRHRLPSDAKAARLRQLLAGTPWWAEAHAHSPRLLTELAPLAIALVLDRGDWLRRADLALLEGSHGDQGTGCTARFLMHTAREARDGPSSVVDHESGAVCAASELVVKTDMRVDMDSMCDVLSGRLLVGNGEGAGECVGDERVFHLDDWECAWAPAFAGALYCPAPHRAAPLPPPAAAAARQQEERLSAAQPPLSMASAAFEAVRGWLDVRAPAEEGGRFKRPFASAVLLELVTMLVRQGEGFETLATVIRAAEDSPPRIAFRVLADHEDGGGFCEMQVLVATAANKLQHGEPQSVLFQSPAEWRLTIPRHLLLAPGSGYYNGGSGQASGVSNPELIAAVENGDAAAVRAILERMLARRGGASAPPFANGNAAARFFEGENNDVEFGNYLRYAAQMGHNGVIDVLCDVGGYDAAALQTALPGQTGQSNTGCREMPVNTATSVLHSAVLQGRVAALRNLLERGARADVPDTDGCTLLYNAVVNGRVRGRACAALVRELFSNERCAEQIRAQLVIPEERTILMTPLCKALHDCSEDVLEALLECGATLPEGPELHAGPPANCFDSIIGNLAGYPPACQYWSSSEERDALAADMRASFREARVFISLNFWEGSVGVEGQGPQVRQGADWARKQASLGRCIELLLRYSPPRNATLLRLLGALRKEVKQKAVGHCSRIGCAESGKKYCARCKAVKYCSNECQKADWKAHKKVCKAPRAADE